MRLQIPIGPYNRIFPKNHFSVRICMSAVEKCLIAFLPYFLAVVSSDFLLYDVNSSIVVPKYFEYLTKTKSFVNECIRASEGSTNRVRLKQKKFLDIKIPYIPLTEQKRVVAKIEKIFSRITQTIKLRATIQKELA